MTLIILCPYAWWTLWWWWWTFCRNKTADFMDYVCGQAFNLVAVTETWFKPNNDSIRAQLCPYGYRFWSLGRAIGMLELHSFITILWKSSRPAVDSWSHLNTQNGQCLLPVLYPWATETPKWARSTTKFISHAFCILLGSAISIAKCL